MRFAITRPFLPVAALLALCARPAAAQQGEVMGRVTDKTSGQALATAQVSVVGTTIRALTGQDGRYRMVNVPAGPATLRVSYIGYATTTQQVTVPASGSAQADFAIAQAAVGLEAIVVTATGDQAVREQGTAAHNVDLRDRTSQAAVSNLSDALNSTVPGVVVQSSGGTTGTGTRVRIRGSNSVSLSNDPVLIVDGIRVENGSNSTSIGVGGQQPSRLNDISPQDLEAVQVNSGPASSVLYGTDAANGAIIMRTRRGQPGATKWTMSAEGGTLNDYGNYPDNYTGLTALDSACALTRVVATVNPCVQVRVRRFNPIEQRSPFRTGHRVQYGISASGGSEQTTFYLAGHFNNEDGVYPVNWNKEVNILANLFDHVRSNMDIQATALYTNGKLRLPQNDNNVFGVLSSGFLGGSDSTANNGYGFLTPAQSFSIRTFQNIDHFTGSVQANYRPLSWLEAHAVIGTDFLSRYDENTTFPGVIPASFNVNASQGNRNANPFQIYNWTGNFYATASFALTPTLNSTTSGGLLYYHLRNHGVLASVQQLTAGTNSLSGGVIPTANEQTLETVTIGRFVEERLSYKNRLFVTGALRSDDNTSFGKRFGNILYPRLSMSWVASEEPFFPKPGWLGALKLRAAYGSSGLHPGPTDALQFFNPTPVVINNTDVPGITIGGLGNAALKPERTNETEAGLDAELRPLSARIAFTYYSKLSHDALIAVTLPPSCGCGTSIFRNLGSVSNKGVEISAAATVIHARNVNVDLSIGACIIAISEVTLGSTATFQGQPFPDHGGSVSSTITAFQRFHLYGLVDGRFGNKLFNSTEQFRCGLSNCRGRNDRTASLAEQAAAVANILGTQAGYMEDADFVKFRELSLTYDAPANWATRIGASSLSFTIAGRNLATWTKYKGLDPELNEAGQNNFTTADFLTQPPVRYWIGRINVAF